jgi:hypothetical protein
LKTSFDTIGDSLNDIDTHRALLAGTLEPADDLDSVIAFSPPVFLDYERHHFLHPFISRKPPAAMRTLPPSPDHIAVLAQARINDPVIGLVAEGTLHAKHLSGGCVIGGDP